MSIRYDMGRIDEIRLHAYLERNKQLTKMLAAKRINVANVADATVESAAPPNTTLDLPNNATECDADTSIDESNKVNPVAQSLFPALFTCAMPVERMSPNNVLLGLFSSSSDIETNSGSKRQNPTPS
jgi:hypothetical protein